MKWKTTAKSTYEWSNAKYHCVVKMVKRGCWVGTVNGEELVVQHKKKETVQRIITSYLNGAGALEVNNCYYKKINGWELFTYKVFTKWKVDIFNNKGSFVQSYVREKMTEVQQLATKHLEKTGVL